MTTKTKRANYKRARRQLTTKVFPAMVRAIRQMRAAEKTMLSVMPPWRRAKI